MNDKLLGIHTDGIQQDSHHNYYNHRYEPTSYGILDMLFENLKLQRTDCFVDYGCGKGRLNFYVNWKYHAMTKGIELNNQYYQDALSNLATYHGVAKKSIQFYCIPAQCYAVEDCDNYFYFFHPFSIEIFRTVLNNILESVSTNPRPCTLILYYPDYEYTYYLETQGIFTLSSILPIDGPASGDRRECFMIYTLG